MQTMAWTDERLAERFERIDERFEQVDKRFDAVDRRIDDLTTETRALRRGMESLHTTLHRGSIGVVISLIGVVGAILVKGG